MVYDCFETRHCDDESGGNVVWLKLLKSARTFELILPVVDIELSWRAPELLRSTCFPGRGTQKGDVYSFALILVKLHSRTEPWSSTGLTPQGQIAVILFVFCQFLWSKTVPYLFLRNFWSHMKKAMQLEDIYRESENGDTILLSISSPNIN